MNSLNRLQQIEDLFHAALEREPAERAWSPCILLSRCWQRIISCIPYQWHP
ncbi:MAG: hypothetical protein ACREAB_16090 [Blastocatellia bacterium]